MPTLVTRRGHANIRRSHHTHIYSELRSFVAVVMGLKTMVEYHFIRICEGAKNDTEKNVSITNLADKTRR